MKLGTLCLFTFFATQPWWKPAEKWSDADARRILSSSPWSKSTRPHGNKAQPALTVRWESAAPVREAHRKSGRSAPVDPDKAFYAIAVAGFPAGQELSRAEASLAYCDRAAAPAASFKVLPDVDGRQLVVFLFPVVEGVRDPGIFRLPFAGAFRSNEFHFRARVGDLEIRQTFPLGPMLYLKRLEL